MLLCTHGCKHVPWDPTHWTLAKACPYVGMKLFKVYFLTCIFFMCHCSSQNGVIFCILIATWKIKPFTIGCVLYVPYRNHIQAAIQSEYFFYKGLLHNQSIFPLMWYLLCSLATAMYYMCMWCTGMIHIYSFRCLCVPLRNFNSIFYKSRK